MILMQHDELIGKKVTVYRNLHKKCYSIKYNNRVVAHGTDIAMEGVTFRVQPAGRSRVLREKRKNVHAFVVGTVLAIGKLFIPTVYQCRVKYNPYSAGSFTVVGTENAILGAAYANIRESGVWCYGMLDMGT